MPEKLATVREHADAIVGKMIQDGKIAPDAEAATLAAGIPTFSKGTATLDPNTGQPVAPAQKMPEFTDGAVAIPEAETLSAEPIPAADAATATPSPAAAAKTKEQILADHQTRMAAPETEQAAQATPADAGTAAAEAAAQAMADAFADFEELEIEDADLGLKYPIRVPKQYAPSAKRGYPRRVAYDRAVSYLKGAEPALREMVEDGRISRVLPLIQRALQDPAYGEYVWQGYDRSTKGLPLIEQARQEAAAAATIAPPTAQESAQFDALELEDPFFAERVRPLQTQLQTVTHTLEQMQARERAQEQRAQEQHRLDTERGNQMRAAHMDLTAAFPDDYSGDLQRDTPTWQRVIQYAKDSGYADAYGLRAGIVFAGQQIHIMDQERLAATASPAAAALASAESTHLELARREAANAARTVGGGAPTQAPPAAKPQKPEPRNPDGSLKPPGQFLRENQQYLAAAAASA